MPGGLDSLTHGVHILPPRPAPDLATVTRGSQAADPNVFCRAADKIGGLLDHIILICVC